MRRSRPPLWRHLHRWGLLGLYMRKIRVPAKAIVRAFWVSRMSYFRMRLRTENLPIDSAYNRRIEN